MLTFNLAKPTEPEGSVRVALPPLGCGDDRHPAEAAPDSEEAGNGE